jgi:hypothetical protein
MRFVCNEWVAGAKAVFEKFAGYVPPQEPASWRAGAKADGRGRAKKSLPDFGGRPRTLAVWLVFVYTGRILKSARAAALPIQQSPKVDLHC